MAQAQAHVLGEAFSHAQIKIVGGDGAFLERFLKAASLGESVDGFIDHSNSAQQLLGGYLSGEHKLGDDLKSAVTSLLKRDGKSSEPRPSDER